MAIQSHPERVITHDFADLELGKATSENGINRTLSRNYQKPRDPYH